MRVSIQHFLCNIPKFALKIDIDMLLRNIFREFALSSCKYTLKNKSASKGSSSDDHSVKGSLKNHLFLTFFYNPKDLFSPQRSFCETESSSDVKVLYGTI